MDRGNCIRRRKAAGKREGLPGKRTEGKKQRGEMGVKPLKKKHSRIRRRKPRFTIVKNQVRSVWGGTIIQVRTSHLLLLRS